MTFLPIVARELRTAARQRSTYRTRTRFALVTSALAALLVLAGDHAAGKQVGNVLFPTLTALAFLYCLVVGARQSADALSEEKREGTLGLLFLTDLRGYDVVLGKFVAISAKSFQALFAFFPVLAIGLVLGGITGGEFWRALAVLTNALFFALCLGLWVSALSRESHRALAGTLALLVVLTVAVPALASALSKLGLRHWGLLTWLSPAAAGTFASDLAYRTDAGRFWNALFGNHLVGWGLLLFASLALPRSWQDRVVCAPVPDEGESRAEPAADGNDSEADSRLRLASIERRDAQRAALLDINPIYWLAYRHESQRLILWTTVVLAVVVSGTMLMLRDPLGGITFGVPSVAHFVLALVLKLSLAWSACATLADARRTGAVELLLATPLRAEEIIRGHWQALQRIYLWPTVATLVLSMIPIIDAFGQQGAPGGLMVLLPIPALGVFGMATFVLDLIATAWVGMWMGLTHTKTIQAFGKTVLFATIIPAVVFCLPNIVFDLFWITWARRKLTFEFRRAAFERLGPPPECSTWVPVPASPLSVPPVIRSSSV